MLSKKPKNGNCLACDSCNKVEKKADERCDELPEKNHKNDHKNKAVAFENVLNVAHMVW